MSGNDQHLVRAIRGPITLITVGALFALNNFTRFGFGQTWPVLLIVFGLLSLLRRGVEQGVPPQQAFPPLSYPPPEPPHGSYRQSSYPTFDRPVSGFDPLTTGTNPPAGPAKGGFGTSAPPRPNEPEQTPPSGDPK